MSGGETLEHHRGGEMLVRARIKRVEDLPDWAKCCEQAVNWMQEYGQALVIDLSQKWDFPKGIRCRYCKHAKPAVRGFRVISRPNWEAAALETLDLDEGPLEAA